VSIGDGFVLVIGFRRSGLSSASFLREGRYTGKELSNGFKNLASLPRRGAVWGAMVEEVDNIGSPFYGHAPIYLNVLSMFVACLRRPLHDDLLSEGENRFALHL
jgi:hypothetical protein